MIKGFLNLKFRYKLFLSYVTVILISALIISFVNYHISASLMESKAAEYSEAVIGQVGTNLDYHITDLEKALFAKYNNSPLARYLKGEGGTGPGHDNHLKPTLVEWNNLLFDILYSENHYQSVLIVDHELRHHYLDREGGEARGVSTAGKEKDARQLRSLWGRTKWSRGDDEVTFLKRAVFDINSSQYLGYIAVGIRSGYLRKVYKSTDLTSAGHLVVLDSENEVILNDAAVAFVGAAMPDAGRVDGHTTIVKNQSGEYLYTFKGLKSGDLKIVNIVPLDYLTRGWDALKYWTMAICLFSLFIAMLLALLISNNISENVSLLLKSIKSISEGHFDRRIVPKSKDEIGLLAEEFNSMSEKVNELMLKVKKEEALKKEAEYKVLEFQYSALQSQINPHFLYNTLDTINSLAKIKGEMEISRLVCLLGNLLRDSICRKSKEILLSEELDYIRKYLEICKTVYADTIDIRYRLDAKLMDLYVPNFILQPIVENAIVHGIEKKRGKRILTVKSGSADDKLVFEVRDNGVGMDDDTLKKIFNGGKPADAAGGSHTKVGIRSVMQRIKLLYGEDFGVRIDTRLGKGTTVQLILPLVHRAGGAGNDA